VSLALGGETGKYSFCAATCEIANSCHAGRQSGGSAGRLAEKRYGSISEKSTGACIGGAGGDDCGADCERDCAAPEVQPGQAGGWEQRNAGDGSAMMWAIFPKVEEKSDSQETIDELHSPRS
jgi:hypothetical protein